MNKRQAIGVTMAVRSLAKAVHRGSNDCGCQEEKAFDNLVNVLVEVTTPTGTSRQEAVLAECEGVQAPLTVDGPGRLLATVNWEAQTMNLEFVPAEEEGNHV